MAIEMNLRGTTLDSLRIGRNKAVIDAAGLTGQRTLVVPDQAGTVALVGPPLRNLIINGGCQISHRGSKTLTTDWQYAEADLIAVKAEGTITAGSIRREATASLAAMGWSCKVQGTTSSGTAAILFRCRVEGRDCWRLKNQPAVFSCRIFHDCGQQIDWAITVNTPTALDDFSSVSQVATGTIANVSPNVEAGLSLAIADMGDCTNGLEVIVRAACGEVSGNNFYLTNVQLEAGRAELAFEQRPVALETALVHRYLQPCSGLIGKANSGSNMQITVPHPGMRAAPDYELTGALAFTDCVTADFTQSQPDLNTVHERDADKGRVSCGYFSGMSAGSVVVQRGTGGVILASSEL